MTFQKKSVSPKLNESFLQLEPTDSHLWRDEGLNLTNERKQDSEDSPENWQAYLINFYEEENNPQQHEKVSEKREMKEFQIMPERKFFPEGKVTNRLKHYFAIFQERFSLYQQQFVPDQLQSLKKTISRLRCKLKQQGGINRKDLGSLLKKKKAREIMSKILIQDHCQNSVSQNKLTYLMASKLFSLRCKSLQLIERNSLP